LKCTILFLLFLMAPLVAGFLKRGSFSSRLRYWQWPLFLAITAFLVALIWFVSLRPLVREGLWKFPRTWYEACFGITFVYIFFALFVFVTSYTPSKYHSRPVPRSAGLELLYLAVVPLIAGCTAYVYGRYKRKPPF
jgi:hypothetical protein